MKVVVKESPLANSLLSKHSLPQIEDLLEKSENADRAASRDSDELGK